MVKSTHPQYSLRKLFHFANAKAIQRLEEDTEKGGGFLIKISKTSHADNLIRSAGFIGIH